LYAQSSSQLGVPNAYRQIETSQRAETLNPTSLSFINPASLLQWGPVTVRPFLNSRTTYGNELASRSGSRESSWVEEFSPGALFQIGTKWQLDYTPTLTFYSSKEFTDHVDHNVNFSGGTSYENWRFGLSQTYTRTADSLIETGRQTDEQTFGTGINASRYMGSRLLLELGFNQSFRDTQEFTSSRTWSTMNWLNYQFTHRMSAGIGIGGGFEDVTPGFDMAFEQVQAKVNVRIAQKLDLAINGGGEVRQILDSGGDPLVNPIYSASIQYHPFQYTTLSLSGGRTISASLLEGNISEDTSISLALNQRLLGMFYLTLSGGYSTVRFIASDNTQQLNRADETISFAANLSYRYSNHGSMSVFYNISDNLSSDGGFSYTSHQVGFDIGYRF
jgi:hypothetical protein